MMRQPADDGHAKYCYLRPWRERQDIW